MLGTHKQSLLLEQHMRENFNDLVRIYIIQHHFEETVIAVRQFVDRRQINIQVLFIIVLKRVFYHFTVSVWHWNGKNNLKDALLQQ